MGRVTPFLVTFWYHRLERCKIRKLIVPEVNAREAAMVEGVLVYPVSL